MSLKIQFVGDVQVGKSALLSVYIDSKFLVEYCPTMYDNYSMEMEYGDYELEIQFWDLGGSVEEDDKPLGFPGTDCFVICYSIVDPQSFEHVKYWAELIQTSHILKKSEVPVPIILLGLKNDLRYDSQCIELMKSQFKCGPISVKNAKAMACQINAVASLLCSAMTQENVREVFDEAIEHALTYSQQNKRRK